MLPAQQRLEPGDLAGLQGHDGLILQPELLPLQCMAQLDFQLQAGHGVLMHNRIKITNPVRPTVLA